MGTLLHFPDRISKLPAPSVPEEPLQLFPEFHEDRFDFDLKQFEDRMIAQAELPPTEGD